jgi:hypothetical protein
LRTKVKILFFSILVAFFANGRLTFATENEKAEKKNDLTLLPIVYYTPETKIAAGLGGVCYLRSSGNHSGRRTSSLLADLVYTQRKQVIFEFLPDLYLKSGNYYLRGFLSLKKYCEKFYGIGRDAAENKEEDYSFHAARLDVSFQKKVFKRVYAGIQYEFEHNKILAVEPGGELEGGELVGSRAGEASGIGLVLSWDSRDSIFFPKRGKYCQVSAKFFSRSFGSDYLFQKLNIDFRQYFPFISSHALAVQAAVNVITGNPPFQMLSLLGGQNLMRGYYRGRYRDKDMIAVQLEYRMPVWRRLGLVGFLGCGDVSERLSQFRLESFKMTGGLGVRYRIQRQESSNLRLDLGFSRESSGVYVTVSEAF